MPKLSRTIQPLSDEDEARIQAQIAADPDNPEWTEEDFAKAKPFAKALPQLADSIKRSRGRPAVEAPKILLTLRLAPSAIDKFKARGPGWQAKMNATLLYVDELKENIEQLKRDLAPLLDGSMKTHSTRGGHVDTTDGWIETLRGRIADLERIEEKMMLGEVP